MDSMQSLNNSVKQLVKRLSGYVLPLFLFGCTATPVQQAPAPVEPEVTQVPVTEEKASDVEKTYLPLTPELVYYILTAEIAGQRGEMGIAVDLYHRASELVASPQLASRSAQVATYSRDQQRINRALERWSEVDPDAADVYIMRAPFLMLKGDFQTAVKMVDKAISLEPEKAESYLSRFSESLTETAEPEQAMSTFEQLQSFKDNLPAAQFIYARMAIFYKQFDKASAIVDELLKQDKGNEGYLVLKADILQRMGHSDEAMALIAKAARSESASNELRFTYGKLLGENGKTKQALQVFEALYDENPENKDVLYALGLLALEEKDGHKAKNYFVQLLKLGDPTHQAEYFIGMAEESLGNIDAALVWFASVPMQSHRFDMAQTRYINLLADRGELDKAREHLQQLRKDHPKQAIQYYMFEAGFLRDRGHDQAAFDLFTKALTEYPENNELLYGRAMVSESLNRLDVLETDLRNILKREPENAQALNALGYTLADRTNRHQEALALIQKALEIKPEDPFYLDSLGWVYYRLGDLDKAELYLQQALQLQPDVEFIAHLGEVLWEQGKHDEALDIWQQGLKQDANNKLLLDTMHRYGQ